MTTANFTSRDASIATQASQKVAAELLRLELEHKAWPLPTKEEERLQAMEARYAQLVRMLLSAALAPYVREVDLDLPESDKPAAQASSDVLDEFAGDDDIPY
jgi:hypothetical protein